MTEKAKLQAKYRGCILGGAINADSISGTLLLAESLLRAEASFIRRPEDYVEQVREGYKKSAKVGVKTLNTAAVGLFFDSPARSAEMARAIAAIKESDVMASATLAYLISLIMEKPELSLLELVRNTLRAMAKVFKGQAKLEEFLEAMVGAIALSKKQDEEDNLIVALGAKSYLAIAIYCALKYQNSIETAMKRAITYGGEAAGAVVGNILGAYFGLEALSPQILFQLKRQEELVALADDLLNGYPYAKDEDIVALWQNKYGANE